MGAKGGRNDDADSGEETFTYSEDPVGLRASERSSRPARFPKGFFSSLLADRRGIGLKIGRR